MDDEEYDEFGNYIGDKMDTSSDESEPEEEEDEGEEGDEVDGEGPTDLLSKMQLALQGSTESQQIVQWEDKEVYPDQSEIYGPGVETIYEPEDMQPIEEPVVQKRIERKFESYEPEIPETSFSMEYLGHLLAHPQFCRSITLAGNLHSGKSTFLSTVVAATHTKYNGKVANPKFKYTDHRHMEGRRGLSIKTSPLTVLLESSRGKSHALTFLDAPGHVNFADEACASIRLSDGVLLFVDCLEGCTLHTEQIIAKCCAEEVPMCLVVNKIDRLILEVRLPPLDAYRKLLHVVQTCNAALKKNSRGDSKMFDPRVGNVMFSSGLGGWSFTCASFAKLYAKRYGGSVDVEKFSRLLWGEKFRHPQTGRFLKKRPTVMDLENEEEIQVFPTFVEFILQPLYKIYAHCLGTEDGDLPKFFAKLRIKVSKDIIKSNIKTLLAHVLMKFFKCDQQGQSHSGMVDMALRYFPSPLDSTKTKFKLWYSGMANSLPIDIFTCDARKPAIVYVTKFYSDRDPSSGKFFALGRVMSGTVKLGMKVRVLGESYSPEEREDVTGCTVEGLAICNTRYNIPFKQAAAGTIVLLSGVSAGVNKTATIVEDTRDLTNCCIFKPLRICAESVCKISVEPLKPSEAASMVEGLRCVDKSYPSLVSRVEESGEHVLLGTGEMFLDCVMHDLRELFARVEIKVSDPVVVFRETITQTSSIKCNATTPNGKNRLTMIAQPLENGLAQHVEQKNLCLKNMNLKMRVDEFGKFNWDILAAKSAWCFGPDEESGANVLLNETFPNEVDPKLLGSIQPFIQQGFKWASREGPLTYEPMRGVKFKLLHARIPDQIIERGSGQIVPTARRVVNASFLTANPQLMEPMFLCEIHTPLDCQKAIYEVLDRRRGHVLHDGPIVGTPMYLLKASVPVLDSYGLETDIRAYTQGKAFVQSVFQRWDVVPGDPLDESIVLRPLEPSPTLYLARECFVKTRKRKGLPERINLAVFLDEEDRRLLNKL